MEKGCILFWDCIVQTEEGATYLRNLHEGTEPGKYTLVCANIDAENKRPLIYNVGIVSAGPLIRHFCKDRI